MDIQNGMLGKTEVIMAGIKEIGGKNRTCNGKDVRKLGYGKVRIENQ